MITERGVIESVEGGKAVVRVQRGTSCASCEHRAACHLDSGKPLFIEVENELEATAGDWVEISLPTRSLLKLSFLVYFVPVLTLVAGALLGAEWAEPFGLSATVGSLVAGGLALVVSFTLLRRFDRSVRRKPHYHPRMSRIVPTSHVPRSAETPC